MFLLAVALTVFGVLLVRHAWSSGQKAARVLATALGATLPFMRSAVNVEANGQTTSNDDVELTSA